MPPAPRIARPDELDALGPLFESVGWSPGASQVAQLHVIRDVLCGEVFAVELEGGLAGCSACVPFEDTGWIGSVAVDGQRRRSGLGTALTESCVQWLRARGAGTISLCATELGRPIYERLGFVAELAYAVYAGAPPPAGLPLPPGVRQATAAELAAALALDRRCTGEGRGVLLRPLWPGRALVHAPHGELRGFFARPWWKPGGAILASDLAAGLALIDAARLDPTALVQLAFPASNTALASALRERGLRELRQVVRMRLGPPLPWAPEKVFSTFNLFWG